MKLFVFLIIRVNKTEYLSARRVNKGPSSFCQCRIVGEARINENSVPYLNFFAVTLAHTPWLTAVLVVLGLVLFFVHRYKSIHTNAKLLTCNSIWNGHV